MDLLPQNIQDYWHSLPYNVRCMLGHPTVDFGNTWVCFNTQNTSDIHIPKHTRKAVVTYHTEYIKHHDLLEFFNLHAGTQFLFLTDWQQSSNQLPWPENVTCVRYLTWHHQINAILHLYASNLDPKTPKHKISSLSFQHDFHKAAITAYLLKIFPAEDCVLSWWNIRLPGRLYYLDPGYFIPKDIANVVLDPEFQNVESIRLDDFENSPLLNSKWSHPAYDDCLFNCTNESIYNNFCEIDNLIYRLPGPYLTEKTWKPLLAGRPFLPVGQSKSLTSLVELGLKFIPEVMEIDLEEKEFSRIRKIWSVIDWVQDQSIQYLFDYTLDYTRHNVSWIRDGHFESECLKHNKKADNQIAKWISAH